MKQLFLLICFFPLLLKSQFYIAGQNIFGYADVNPDTLINYPGPPETFSIDVNGDNQNDLQIKSFYWFSPGGQTKYIVADPLDPKCYLLFGRHDSVYNVGNNSWCLDYVAKPLAFGDTINKLSAIWINSVSTISNETFYQGCNKNIQDWVNPADRYIGVKYNAPTGTLFGWIRIHVPVANKCYLKDYSFSCGSISLTATTSASLICSGETATLTANGANSYTWSTGVNSSSIVVSPTVTANYTVNGTSGISGCSQNTVFTQNVDACIGINEYSLNKINVYPNPANDILYIDNDQNYFTNTLMEVDNAIGQTVVRTRFREQINVTHLAAGVYSLRIISPGGRNYCVKFIKD